MLFLQNDLFRKILSGIPSVCQTVCIKIRLSGLGPNYSQMTLVVVGKRVTASQNHKNLDLFFMPPHFPLTFSQCLSATLWK